MFFVCFLHYFHYKTIIVNQPFLFFSVSVEPYSLGATVESVYFVSRLNKFQVKSICIYL